jgi:hypothetical protein
MANQSFDAGGMARDQQSRIAASAAIWINALRPIMQCQASMLRFWAGNIESLAQNYEKGLDTFSSAVEHDRQQQRAA